MTAVDLETEYSPRVTVPDHAQIFARWARTAEDYRADMLKSGKAQEMIAATPLNKLFEGIDERVIHAAERFSLDFDQRDVDALLQIDVRRLGSVQASQGLRLVAALTAVAGQRQDPLGAFESVLEPVGEDVRFAQMHQDERLDHSVPHRLSGPQRLFQQWDALGSPL